MVWYSKNLNQTTSNICNFIDTGEQTLANEIERFCRMTDPTFTDWTIFKNDAKTEVNSWKMLGQKSFIK